MGKHDRLWVCPKCGVTMLQPSGVKSVSHDCPKTDPLVFVALERTYTASTG